MGASVSSSISTWNRSEPISRTPMRREIGGRLALAVDRLGEERAVPHGLDGDEDGVEQNGDRGEEPCLEGRQARVGLGLGEVRHDQREHRERGDDHEKGTRAFEIVFLFPKAQRPHQQRRAHHAVEHDHQGGEHGVAGKGRVVLAVQDDRRHERDLDDDHRDGEHERAVGLAEMAGDGVGDGAPR